MTSLSGSSLASITPQILTPRDTIAAQQANAKSAPTTDAEAATKAADSAGTTTSESASGAKGGTDASGRIQGPKLNGSAGGAGGAAESGDDSNDSVVIKTIKEQIAQIQKQLAAVMQQIQGIQQGNMDERSKA